MNLLVRKSINFVNRLKNYKNIAKSVFTLTFRKKLTVDIFIDVGFSYDRYLLGLIQYFCINNFNVCLKFDLINYSKWNKYFIQLSEYENFSLAFKKTKSKILFISDKEKCTPNILVRSNYFKNPQKNELHFPFTLHPTMYFANFLATLKIPKRKRKILIGFAGNLDSAQYHDVSMLGEVFISRVNLVKQLIYHHPDLVLVPKSKDEYFDLFESERVNNKICIIDRKYFSLEGEEYFEFLGSCRYSICPPGINMPYCHNIAESLFSGTIPILQYAHLMKPKLQTYVNCLSFTSTSDFIALVEDIIKNRIDYDNLEKHSLTYYNQNINPKSFINKLVSKSKSKRMVLFLLSGVGGSSSVNQSMASLTT